jgi:AcrR family transcriptional regulator
MPKGFSNREREIIKEKLLAMGKEYFGAHGVKKTNVEDLARAAGISKGAFYAFYNSKEELYFDILGRARAGIQQRILDCASQPGKPPRQRLKELLREAFSIWRTDPILANFSNEEYEHLLRKLPEDKVLEHTRGGDAFIEQLIAICRGQGIPIDRDPRTVAGLLRALFFVSLHEEDVGIGVYKDVMEVLEDLVSGYLVPTTSAED